MLTLPDSSCRRMLCFVSLLILSALLAGCGTYYTVSVDSLRDDQGTSGEETYFLMPGNEGVSENDLLFRDVCRMLAPAFAAQGYRVVSDRNEAQHKVLVSYWEDEPRTVVESGTRYRSVPVTVWHGRSRRIEYVRVEEPTLTTHTVYTAQLLLEASVIFPKDTTRPVWRTSVTCSGSSGTLRTLLSTMIPALEATLGTRTEGGRTFEVFVNDKGEMSMDESY